MADDHRSGKFVEYTSQSKGKWSLIEVKFQFSTGKEWTSKYPSFKSEIHDVVKGLKPGDLIDLYYEKNAKGYWDLDRIEVKEKASVASGGGDAQSGNSASGGNKGGGKFQPGAFRDPNEINRTEALQMSMSLFTGALAAGETHGELIKKTETMENLKAMIKESAAEFYAFIKGKDTTLEPDGSDLAGGSDLDQPGTPGSGDDDEDIPF